MMTKPLEILLVEDNPHDAEIAIRALKKRRLANNLIHLADGQVALDFLFGAGAYEGRDLRHQPKVVLLDLKLPKLDGIEVLRQVRADDRTKLLPVVVLTSSREDRDVLESYQCGANSYIVKPVDFDSFATAIASFVHFWFAVATLPPDCPQQELP